MIWKKLEISSLKAENSKYHLRVVFFLCKEKHPEDKLFLIVTLCTDSKIREKDKI